jgi:hypothetical protein
MLACAGPMPLPAVPKAHSGADVTRCLTAVQEGDPSAAKLLYSMYAEPIRAFLRRHTGIQEVENTVFSILVEAVRVARNSGTVTLSELSETVKDLSQQGVFGLRRKAAARDRRMLERLSMESRRDLVNGLFSVLKPSEREILMRSSLLAEDDTKISTGLAIPITEISRTRAKARVLLQISSQTAFEYGPAATA